jgi:hypothetical protein
MGVLSVVVKVDVNRLVVFYVINVMYNIIQKSTCQSIPELKRLKVPILSDLKNNYCIFVSLSVKDGMFTFSQGEMYNLCIINHMCSIGSGYLPKSDKLDFVDILVI